MASNWIILLWAEAFVSWLLLLAASALALKITDDLTGKKKSLQNQRRLKFGYKSLPNTINFT